jgi:hypothetical protein
MNDHNHTNSTDSGSQDQGLDLDVLIGRIVDGEASDAERRRFEGIASGDGSLWRRLALRQQDMSMLVAHVEPALDAAESIELPAVGFERSAPVIGSISNAHSDATRTGPRWSWWAACAGWAAVVAIAATWGISQQLGGIQVDRQARQADARPVSIAPEEHLREYLGAPFVLGEMTPTLLNVETLSDGRYAVSYLRRIVEVSYFDAPEEIPLDEEGNLIDAPHALPPSTRPTPESSN